MTTDLEDRRLHQEAISVVAMDTVVEAGTRMMIARDGVIVPVLRIAETIEDTVREVPAQEDLKPSQMVSLSYLDEMRTIFQMCRSF
jgi:hypothetical protein